jgi:hypothetical protein
MRCKTTYAPLAALVFLALLAQLVFAATGRVVNLVLPHSLRSGETAWLELDIGTMERGAEIEIATTTGRPLGVISPFGIRSGHQAGTYTVPVPAEAISDDHISLRVSLDQYGHEQRAPTADEVKAIRVKVMPAKCDKKGPHAADLPQKP